MIDKANEYLDLVKEAMDANLYGSASAERLLKDWSKNKNTFSQNLEIKPLLY